MHERLRRAVGDRLRQEVAHDSSAASGRRGLDRAGRMASNAHRGSDAAAAALPREGEKFTEGQMVERFGASPPGGIRLSKISSDIILVRRADVPNHCNDGDPGDCIYHGGYAEEHADRMIDWRNKALSESGKNGNRVLFFVKDGDKLVFHGCVECAGWEHGNVPNRGKAVTFKMRRIGSAAARPAGPARYATAVKIARDEDGGYVATAPALPACISQGETRAEAQENLAEAISLYLEYHLEGKEAFSPDLPASLDVASIYVDGGSVDTKIATVPHARPRAV